MKKGWFQKNNLAAAYLGLGLAVFFWAINTVIARGVIFQIKPMALSFYRWVVALAVIIPVALPHLKKDAPLIRENIWFFCILAIPSVAVYNSVLYLGAQYTTATNISLVVATMPIMTMLLSWIITREKTGWRQILGVMISLSGMLIIITKGSLQILMALKFNLGDLLIVLSITSWAFYSVMLKTRDIRISPYSFLTVMIVFGILCILPFYIWETAVFGGFQVNFKTVVIFIYLGICPSILSYICWYYGVRTAGASVASVFMYLVPVFTAVIASVVLGEHLLGYHYSGGLLIFAGLLLSAFR